MAAKKKSNDAQKWFDQQIAQIQKQSDLARKRLASRGITQVRLSATRAQFIADHWDDSEIFEDVAFEVGCIREELNNQWKQWKSNHPIKALFKSQREKVLSYLRNCHKLFGTRDFYVAFAKGEYGERFSGYRYYGRINPPWPNC